MKNIYITLFSCLVFGCSLSQDIDYIKTQEVLILYCDSDNSSSVNKISNINSDGIETLNYTFNFESDNNVKETIKLYHRTFMNYDDQDNDKKAFSIRVNKSFLRKNKKMIITKKLMDKIGYQSTIKLFSKAKRILLIDNNDTIDKKIVLKEVRLVSEILI